MASGASMPTSTIPRGGDPASCLFESLVELDYDSLLKLYAANARNSVVSYLAMKSRWAQQQQRQQEQYAKSGKTKTFFSLSVSSEKDIFLVLFSLLDFCSFLSFFDDRSSDFERNIS